MKRIKAGTSKAAAAERKVIFAHEYLLNGMNAKNAALKAGYAPSGAEAVGSRLTRDPKVLAIISGVTENAAKKAGLSVERTLLEVSRLAYSDPRRFYDKKTGQLIPVHLLDDDVAACIASLEVDEIKVGQEVVGQTKKIKHWDKNSALEKAMKYHGLYEADNKQKPQPVLPPVLQIVAVPGKK